MACIMNKRVVSVKVQMQVEKVAVAFLNSEPLEANE